MNKFWIVASHTYLSKVKGKSFIISTAIMLVLIIAFSNMQKIIDLFASGDDTRIGVIQQSGEHLTALKNQLKTTKSDIKWTEYSAEADAKKAEADEDIEGYLVLSDKDGVPVGTYKAQSIADSSISTEIKNALQQVQTTILTKKVNISDEQLAAIYAPVSFKMEALDKNAKSEDELNQARGLVYVLIFAIYFSVLLYANMIATEVAVEKSSRVMEILISSISPIQQMFAKITGVALVTITQMIVFLIGGYLSIKSTSGTEDNVIFEFFGFGDVPVATIIYAVVFILLGYLLYAVLAATLGSLVSRIEDLQQMITPMTMLVIIGFFIAMMGLGDPEAKFITVTSYIPFFTPMIMFLRIGMLEISNVEIAISIAILIATIILVAYIGAKVYKGGVLLYGKSSSFKDVKKAINLTKNN